MARRNREDTPLRDTGEPVMVVRLRRDFGRWAAVSGGLFAVNMMVAGGPHNPWSLIVAGFMAIPMFRRYSELWQAGYSWRDVIHRPAAPDAVGAGGKNAKGVKQIAAPTAELFGRYRDRMEQVHRDRSMILGLMNQLSPADKELLPDVAQTTDALYERASQLAQTLHSMESLGIEDAEQIEARLAELRQRPEGEERDRQITLLEQQLRACRELSARRVQFSERFESCLLAMQNVRLDLMRLRQSGVGAVLNNLTQATQQARALSRDVDHVIGAAAELKETM